MSVTRQIPYVDLAAQHAPLKEKLLAAIGEVIDRGHFILGEEVAEFEQAFAELCGVSFAVGLNSGTDALILALKALGIGSGHEVITVPNSFVASASCIALVGARPVFVDVGEDYNLDPTQLARAITPRTRAILPVHLSGRPADMDPIMEIAQAHGLHVIEDAAQAVLAEYKGKRVGSFGIAGCFSLHPLKTLNSCGDGGMLTTNDAGLAEKCRILRNLGLETRDNCTAWSGNSRLDTIQAAILLVKMGYLETWTEKRRANARYYQEHLTLSQLEVPRDKPYERAVYHTFVIQADRRDQLQEHLASLGIGSAIHYPRPIHLQQAARELGYSLGSFPVAERQAQRILSLPVYPELNEDELKYIVDAIRQFYQGR
jgi:dTDP-4-amino-4,6-dideoxygalactose transaminase